MCWNCGCMMPDDPMGSPDNLTTEKLRKAVKAGGNKNLKELVENFNKTYKKKIKDTPVDTAVIT
ncbi:MAG: hypothetical protein Q7R34_16010 [Dehalococcoidia bacterium]|nr:hypothetical protein [Dehalococcoidia bacterium]